MIEKFVKIEVQVKKKSRNTAEILLFIFAQNFRTFCGDKKVKNVWKCYRKYAEKWTAKCQQNFCSFFLLGRDIWGIL